MRIDPITGIPGQPGNGDLGRVYYASGRLTTTRLVADDGPFAGQILVAGSILASMSFDDGLASTAQIGAGGNIGAFVGSTRVGGLVVDGRFQGQLVVLGDLIGDMTISGGLSSTGRIAVKGSSVTSGGILGNVTINGGLSAGAALVSGGVIGRLAPRTALTINGNVGGIVAAKGAINWNLGPPKGSNTIFSDLAVSSDANSIASAMAIDQIFSSGQLSQVFPQLAKLKVTGKKLIDT